MISIFEMGPLNFWIGSAYKVTLAIQSSSSIFESRKKEVDYSMWHWGCHIDPRGGKYTIGFDFSLSQWQVYSDNFDVNSQPLSSVCPSNKWRFSLCVWSMMSAFVKDIVDIASNVRQSSMGDKMEQSLNRNIYEACEMLCLWWQDRLAHHFCWLGCHECQVELRGIRLLELLSLDRFKCTNTT